MKQIKATTSNIDEFRSVHSTLVSKLDELARMTEKYPVVFTFEERRWVFESRADIETLILDLTSAIERFEAAA